MSDSERLAAIRQRSPRIESMRGKVTAIQLSVGDFEWLLSEHDRLLARVGELEAKLETVSLWSIEASNPGIDMDEVKRLGGYGRG